MNDFDQVIILCPNTSYDQGAFEKYGPDGAYIGGQIRMQAAVDLYNSPEITIRAFIVVGGGVDAEPARRWAKTNNMRQFLMQNGIPAGLITCVSSGADTLGNLRAIWVTCHELLAGKTIGLLTNDYHLPRAMLMAHDSQFDWAGARFFPLPAEAHSSSASGLPHPQDPGLQERLRRELQGRLDWQHGVYQRQYLPSSEWRGILCASHEAGVVCKCNE